MRVTEQKEIQETLCYTIKKTIKDSNTLSSMCKSLSVKYLSKSKIWIGQSHSARIKPIQITDKDLETIL